MTDDGTDAESWCESRSEAHGLAVEIVAPAAIPDAAIEAMAAAIHAANELGGQVEGAVAVLLDDDARLRDLNRRWRGIDRPTNVLSFGAPGDRDAGPSDHVGDIAISHETAAREAGTDGKPLRDHLAHLAAHGFLHLIGYDHETDDEAEAMERLERDILARLGVPDPYIARDGGG